MFCLPYHPPPVARDTSLTGITTVGAVELPGNPPPVAASWRISARALRKSPTTVKTVIIHARPDMSHKSISTSAVFDGNELPRLQEKG